MESILARQVPTDCQKSVFPAEAGRRFIVGDRGRSVLRENAAFDSTEGRPVRGTFGDTEQMRMPGGRSITRKAMVAQTRPASNHSRGTFWSVAQCACDCAVLMAASRRLLNPLP